MVDLYFSERMYDWLIESLLKSIKLKITRCVFEYNLFPVLDICSGTGTQCYLMGRQKQNVIGLDYDARMVKYAVSKYSFLPFICAEAGHIPFRDTSFKGIVISYALHDKPSKLRKKIVAEVKRLLAPEGKIILVDFEHPWNKRSRLGAMFTYMIERMAGDEHFRNGRVFLQQGGLRAFVKEHKLNVIEKHLLEFGRSSLVVAEFS